MSRGPTVLAAAALAVLAAGSFLHAYVLFAEADTTIGKLRAWDDPESAREDLGEVLVVHGRVVEKERVATPSGDAHVLTVSDGTGAMAVRVHEAEFQRFRHGDRVKITFVWNDETGRFGSGRIDAAVPHAPFLAAYGFSVPALVTAEAWRRRAASRTESAASALAEEDAGFVLVDGDEAA